MSKSCRNFCSSVDSCKLGIFRVAAQFQSFLDYRCKVFFVVNMGYIWEGYHFCGKYSVFVAGFWRHETVGRVENRCRNMVKFFLLILPCGSEISFQMWEFFQFRISMCRKHFSMCVNVDSFSFCLLKEEFEIVEIVSCHYDERAFFYFQRYGYRCRCTKGFSVCFIKERHAA